MQLHRTGTPPRAHLHHSLWPCEEQYEIEEPVKKLYRHSESLGQHLNPRLQVAIIQRLYLVLLELLNCFAGDKIWVADSRGKIGCLNLDTSQIFRRLKGPSGSIRDLQIHPTMPIIASAGLDQFLYLHNIQTGNLLAR